MGAFDQLLSDNFAQLPALPVSVRMSIILSMYLSLVNIYIYIVAIVKFGYKINDLVGSGTPGSEWWVSLRGGGKGGLELTSN